jgi:hypothetical protein
MPAPFIGVNYRLNPSISLGRFQHDPRLDQKSLHAEMIVPKSRANRSHIAALGAGSIFPEFANDPNAPRHHDCNEIVMMKESEPVNSNTPWTKHTSL